MAAIAQDNLFFVAHGSCQALPYRGEPPRVLLLERNRFIWEERLCEQISIFEYSRDLVIVPRVIGSPARNRVRARR